MADKSKSKTAPRAKAKAAKPADVKAAKPAESAPAAPKPATSKPAASKTKTSPAKAAGKSAKAAGKGAKPTRKSKPEVAAAATHVEPSVETYYFCSGVLPLEIRTTPPEGGIQFVEFSSFSDARDHLLDQLIELIEEHERELHSIRRTASFAEYLYHQR